MTNYEKVVLSAYTGICLADVTEIHQYIEKILERPVLTHELADEHLWEEIRQKAAEDLFAIIGEEEAPKFNQYLAQINDLAQHECSYEQFIAIQRVQTDILNDYTNGHLSTYEKKTLYAASDIIMDQMRRILRREEEMN